MTTLSAASARFGPAGPRPLRWTCAQFHRFGDLGAFEGRRAMLIDGVILEQGPMNPPHATAQGLVEEAIRTAFGTGWRHQSPDPTPGDYATRLPLGPTEAIAPLASPAAPIQVADLLA